MMRDFWKNGIVAAFIKYPGGGAKRENFTFNDEETFQRIMKSDLKEYGRASIIHDKPKENVMLVFFGDWLEEEAYTILKNYKHIPKGDLL